MNKLDKRLSALEQAGGGPARYFVVYPDEGRYVLPGGTVTDSDTFTQAVERAGNRAVVIKVVYANEGL